MDCFAPIERGHSQQFRCSPLPGTKRVQARPYAFRHDHVLNVDAWQACSIECGNAKEDAGGSAEADLSLGMQV